MNKKDVIKQLNGLKDLELNAENVLMKDGTSVETSILNLQNEISGARTSLIDTSNRILSLIGGV